MVDDIKPRTFVKEGPDGETLTRQVTSPQAEVAARYDGFMEKGEAGSSSGKSTGGRSGNAANTGGSQS